MAYSRPTLFYGLREPGGHIRYIGRTDYSLRHRLRQHISVALRNQEMHRPVYAWIAECIERGISVEIVKLAEVEPQESIGLWLNENAIECCLIQLYSRRSEVNRRPPLLNATTNPVEVAHG